MVHDLSGDGTGTEQLPEGLNRKHLVIYTDGSCLENSLPAHLRTSAGWGFVVLDGFSYKDSQAGPVIRDPLSPGFMGAEEFSNNSGELSALQGALLYAEQTLGIYESVTLVYDSCYVAFSAAGLFEGDANYKLINNIKNKVLQLSFMINIFSSMLRATVNTS